MAWRVGRKLGRTLYRDEHFVGVVDSAAIALEIVDAMNARESAPPPTSRGSRYAHSSPSSNPPPDVFAPKTIPEMAAVRPPATAEPKTGTRRRSESAAKESLLLHYRKQIAEEGAAIAVHEDSLSRLRKDPKVARFLEATRDLEEATRRREQAARDLGLFVAGERIR